MPHKNLRHKVWRALNTDEVAEPNAFAVWAAEAAYNYGDKWLDELRGYIYNNKRIGRISVSSIGENLAFQ